MKSAHYSSVVGNNAAIIAAPAGRMQPRLFADAKG
jgi:hypothetical protein